MYRKVFNLSTGAYVSMYQFIQNLMPSLALYLMLPSGLRFRLNTQLELIARADVPDCGFAFFLDGLLLLLLLGLSIASRYASGSPSEPASTFAITVTAVAFPLAMLLAILLGSTPFGRSFSSRFCLSSLYPPH